MDIWQFVSGGGEGNETHLEAAKRESFEEANIISNSVFYKLDAICTIPAEIYGDKNTKVWGKDCFVIPEYSFGVKLTNQSIKLSNEHTYFKWVDYDTARSMLKYDSNRTALYELNKRIKEDMLEVCQ